MSAILTPGANLMPYKNAAQQREYQRLWMENRRKAWFAEHGPCSKCGSWLDLENHHRDRTKKVSHKVFSWTKARREAELAKCDVVCNECHKTETKKVVVNHRKHDPTSWR